MAARTLDTYLSTAGSLARLSAHAGRLLKLQRIFEQCAPSYLTTASRVANYKSGRVVIHADSGAVAAKLRQMLPSVADNFSLVGAEVTEIQVKVQPGDVAMQHAGPRNKRAVRRAAISEDAKERLQSLADALPDGSALKTPLQRLVRDSR